MTQTYRASSLDMLRSDSRIVTVLGPADFGDLARVQSRVLALASIGPATRLGLRADQSSTGWVYEPDRVLEHITEGPAVGHEQLAKELTEFSHASAPGIPLRMRLAGRYLFLDLNHGLGDALLPVDLFAYLADARPDAPLPAWAASAVDGHPLRKALLRWVVRNPRKVVDTIYDRVRPGSNPESTTSAAAPDTPSPTAFRPWAPSAAVATAVTRLGTTDAIRRWRESHLPGASVSAVMCAAVASAFARTSFPLDRSAAFLFDCRRYLPPSSVVLGNFAAGIGFTDLDPTSAGNVHDALAGAIAKGRPIASATISTIKYKREHRAVSGVFDDRVPVRPKVKLMYSDVGRVRQLEPVSWLAEPADRAFFVIADPGRPESVMITMETIGSVVFVSASFHDNVFDSHTVQAALDLVAADPLALLAPQEKTA
ncbi:hypothetical protein CH251_11250 [Rhodococcus sp. 06-462-5]|uniref:hypothetical protein n=1 Tax=unclassified Rhodococcus (in: high G+C Gram-positive bacteria) TaxID=192944 RepID=UPI000B9A8A3C|nr:MULTISPECIES: hypothetical protein [unclassified Rhodococcus (in: high G+C Gram-positive bacteria)]OZC75325.1 hypothetical protein CH251_11250 [Rhodococcus sp. 06-462-5]OZE67844.1 hypothetical protein CH270_08850 [Rhodococcus sp. 02-925g]